MAEVVIMDNKCELTNLTKTCILHALHILMKRDNSRWEQIQKFCRELNETVTCSNAGKAIIKADKKSHFYASVPGVSHEEPLQIDTDEFYKGLLTAKDILLLIEQKLVQHIDSADFDHNSLFRVCWKVYRVEKRPDSVVTEFSSQHPESDDCMYYLWLVFNAIISPEADEMRIPVRCLDEVMRRVFDLCGHECSRDELVYSTTNEMLEYPEYLKAIANYNVKFDLKKTLTCEVIQDLKDEIVDAVLKKSYLTKKGHKMRTWKRRWFVLKKTIVRYYESKEKPVQKGQMVLNASTIVRERDDIGRRMHCLEVICGRTKKVFEMSADDEKSRHEWILAIKKAIDLAKILSGKKDKELLEHSSNRHLSNFYLIKFGASQSIIPRWEGGIKQVFDCGQNDFSEDEDEMSKSTESNQGPTAGSVTSTTSQVQGGSTFIRNNLDSNNKAHSFENGSTSPSFSPKGSPAYDRRKRFRSNPNGQLPLTDEPASSESIKDTESTFNRVEEITDSTLERPVEDSTDTSGESAPTQGQVGNRELDIGSYLYGPEDAPAEDRPHAQTFLDKMQNYTFQDMDPSAVPDFEESYCDL